MANRIVKRANITHNFDSNASYDQLPYDGYIPPEDEPAYSLLPKAVPSPEVDKSKSISQMTDGELQNLIRRLREETQAEDIIRQLQVNSGAQGDFNHPIIVNTTTPINQLYHYGIPGMKWGVRRFQNKDGTRTAAGKKREAKQSKTNETPEQPKAKKTDNYTTDELRKLNERLRLEAEYKKLTTTDVEKSKGFVSKVLSTAGEQAATEFAKSLMLGSAKLLVKELSPELANASFKIKDTDKKKD